MKCGNNHLDPASRFEDYVHDLILVASCGDGDARYLFLQRYAEQLGGLANHLGFLPEQKQTAAFEDALLSREGRWPQSLPGFRLAVPRWYVRRVTDPLGIWKRCATYVPAAVAIDPVCGMLVDPDETPFVSRRNGQDVFFCCPGCLKSFERRVDDLAIHWPTEAA
jgi:YHS domain-containing protein